MPEINYRDFSGGAAFSDRTEDNQVIFANGMMLTRGGILRTSPLRQDLGKPAGATATLGIFLFDVADSAPIFTRDQFIVGCFDHPTTPGIYVKDVSLANPFPATTWDHIPGTDADDVPRGLIRIKSGTHYYPGVVCDSGRVVYYIHASDSFAVFNPTGRYPGLTADVGNPNIVPVFGQVTTWGDFLVLGSIEWNPAAAGPSYVPNPADFQRYTNMVWLSDPIDQTKYDPRYPVRVCEDDMAVKGLQVCDEGLYVIHNSGVNLLRGLPSDYVVNGFGGKLDKLLSGTVIKGWCWWADTNSLVVATDDFHLYQIRGGRLTDITFQDDINAWRVGAHYWGAMVAVGDHIIFEGEDLNEFFGGAPDSLWRRRTTYLGRQFGDSIAWTTLQDSRITGELTEPSAHYHIGRAVAYDHTVWGIAGDDEDAAYDGHVWRMDMDRQASSFDGVSLIPNPEVVKARVTGKRLQGREAWPERATFKMGIAPDGDVTMARWITEDLEGEVELTEFPLALGSDVPVTVKHTVPGPGPTSSFDFEVEVTGEVVFDSITITYEDGDHEW